MIVDTMTFSEIRKEILNDWLFGVLPKVLKILADNKYRKFIIKSNKNETIYFKHHEIISKRKNRFILIPFSYGKADFKKYGMCFFAFTSFRIGKKLYYARVDCNGQSVSFYSWHLLERYYERLYGYTDRITEVHILKFVKENSIALPYEQYNTKYINGEFGRTDKGILLGQRIDERTVVYNTFITEEMAKGKQIEISDFLNGQLDNLAFDSLGNRYVAA